MQEQEKKHTPETYPKPDQHDASGENFQWLQEHLTNLVHYGNLAALPGT
jgi:hypothetical protein